MILIACGFWKSAGAQYYVLFTSNRDGKAVPDLSVHMTLLREGKSPVYGFYITDNLGIIQVPDSGNYLIQVGYAGFKTFQDTLHVHHQRPHPLRIQLEALQYDLNEVVVTGEFEVKTVDQSVNRVRTIDRKRIEKQGAVNLRDLLSNELNIRLNLDPELGTGMSLQGISGQNVKILIDGVPLIGRTDGTIDLSQINLANIERVEIIEGPMSVMYGSDALGGVINLITKKGSSHTLEGNLNSYYESNGTWNFDGRVGLRKNKLYGTLALGRNFFEGMSIGNEVRSMTWKPRIQKYGDLTLGYKYKNSIHRVQSSLFLEKLTNRSEPVFTPYAIYGRDAYFYTTRFNNGLFSDFRINPNTTFNSIVSYSWFQRVKASYVKDLVNLTEQPIQESGAWDTARFGLILMRGILTHRFDKVWQIQLGYDINLESGLGERFAGGTQKISDYALFSSLEIQATKRLNLKPGLRASYNSRYGSPLVPAFNVKYDFTSWLTLRSSYARGFRAPSLKELSLFFVDQNHNIQGNEDLLAEKSDNINASITANGKFFGWMIRTELAAYHNRLYDMINLALVDADRQLYKYVNIENFRTQGLNVSMDGRRDGLNILLGYSLTGRWSPFYGKSFTYSPEYRANFTWSIPRVLVDFSVFYKFTGATPGFALDANEQVIQTRVDSYSTMDVSLSKTFWKRRITLVAGAKNLFNVTNINYAGAATGGVHSGGGSSKPVNMGRTGFVSLRFNFIEMK